MTHGIGTWVYSHNTILYSNWNEQVTNGYNNDKSYRYKVGPRKSHIKKYKLYFSRHIKYKNRQN